MSPSNYSLGALILPGNAVQLPNGHLLSSAKDCTLTVCPVGTGSQKRQSITFQDPLV